MPMRRAGVFGQRRPCQRAGGLRRSRRPHRRRGRGGRPRDVARVAVGHVTSAGLLELVDGARDRVADDLDPPEVARHLELRVVRAARRATRHLEHGVEVVLHRPAALRVGPTAAVGQLPVLRPDAERQREGAHLVARHRRVDRHHAARDLLLHHRVAVLAQVRVPERVVAELEALLAGGTAPSGSATPTSGPRSPCRRRTSGRPPRPAACRRRRGSPSPDATSRSRARSRARWSGRSPVARSARRSGTATATRRRR